MSNKTSGKRLDQPWTVYGPVFLSSAAVSQSPSGLYQFSFRPGGALGADHRHPIYAVPDKGEKVRDGHHYGHFEAAC